MNTGSQYATPQDAEEGVPKKSDAVIAATTLVETGFPINTLAGDQILAVKNPDGTVEGEDGTIYEPTEDQHVQKPAEDTTATTKSKSTAKSE